jgi:hypothetical protein
MVKIASLKKRIARRRASPETSGSNVIRREIISARRKLARVSLARRDKAGHTTRRIRRELNELARRSPGFAPVKVHSDFVKRLANSVAKKLQEKHGMRVVDRGKVNQAALAHDSRRDFKKQDLEAQVIWAKRGAPAIGNIIGTGESWTLRNDPYWPLEKKIVAWGDNICRGVKVGDTFVNGIVPSRTAYRLLVSQRQANQASVDNLTRERQAVLKFETDLKSRGLDPDSIVREQMQRNPKGFEEEVQRAIDQNVGRIINASLRRLKISQRRSF